MQTGSHTEEWWPTGLQTVPATPSIPQTFGGFARPPAIGHINTRNTKMTQKVGECPTIPTSNSKKKAATSGERLHLAAVLCPTGVYFFPQSHKDSQKNPLFGGIRAYAYVVFTRLWQWQSYSLWISLQKPEWNSSHWDSNISCITEILANGRYLTKSYQPAFWPRHWYLPPHHVSKTSASFFTVTKTAWKFLPCDLYTSSAWQILTSLISHSKKVSKPCRANSVESAPNLSGKFCIMNG